MLWMIFFFFKNSLHTWKPYMGAYGTPLGNPGGFWFGSVNRPSPPLTIYICEYIKIKSLKRIVESKRQIRTGRKDNRKTALPRPPCRSGLLSLRLPLILGDLSSSGGSSWPPLSERTSGTSGVTLNSCHFRWIIMACSRPLCISNRHILR